MIPKSKHRKTFVGFALLCAITVFTACSHGPGAEQYHFNGQGKLLSKVSPDGKTTEYKYNDQGLLTEINFDESTVQFGYDKNGNRIWMQDETGTAEYYYDAFDRVIGVISKHSPWRLIAYDYDPWGNLIYVAIYNLQMLEQELKFREFLNELNQDLNLKQQKWLDFEFKLNEMMHQVRQENLVNKQRWLEYEVEYRYDLFRNLTNIQTKWGNIHYSYDSEKGLIERRLPNGINTRMTTGQDGLLKSIRHENSAGGLIAEYRYDYNTAGYVAKVHEITPQRSSMIGYVWDTRGYLKELHLPDGNKLRYQYDAMGNRILKQDATGTLQYNYDNFGKLVGAGDTKYEWDANGNLASQIDRQFHTRITYDDRGLPQVIMAPEATVQYNWDGNGNLISRNAGDQITHYLQNPLAPLGFTLAEYDQSNRLTSSYLYGDALLGQQDINGQMQWLLEDGFNSIRRIVDINGRTLGQVDYTPFVEPINIQGGMPVNFRMAGERFLPEMKTLVIDTRLYEPNLGRYFAANSFPGFMDRFDSMNRYAHGCNAAGNFSAPRCNQTHKSNRFLSPTDLRRFWNPEGEPQGMRNFLEFLGQNSNWIGHRRSGGEWIEPRSIGNTRIEPINRFDEVGRAHDINIYLSNLYPPGTRVLVPGPRGMEEFIVQPNWRARFFLPWERLFKWRSTEKNKDKEKPRRRKRDTIVPPMNNYPLFPPPPPCPPFCGEGDGDTTDDPPKDSEPAGWGGPGGPGGLGGGSFAGESPLNDPFKTIDNQLGGIELTATAEFIGDLGSISGAVYDPEKQCVVLVGERDISLPPMKPEDLAIALLSVYAPDPQDLQFSLDPADPQNPRGEWLKKVYYPEEILAGTSFGKAMFEADWLLKQYAFGVSVDSTGRVSERKSSVREFKSTADLSFEGMGNAHGKESWARLWIVADDKDDDEEHNMTLKLATDSNSIYYDIAKMAVKAKKQIADPTSPTGLRDVDTDEDAIATEFAGIFSEFYDEISKEAPEFGRVKELAKAVALAKWLKQQRVLVDLAWVAEFANKRIPTVGQISALSVTKEKRYTNYISKIYLFGGVDARVDPKYVKNDGTADKLQETVISKLRKADVGPIFSVQHDGKVLRAAVLPITRNGQDLWKNSPALEVNGTVYQFNNGGKLIRATSGGGNGSGNGSGGRSGDDSHSDTHGHPEEDSTEYSYGTDGGLETVTISKSNGWKMIGEKNGNGSLWTSKSPRGNSFKYEYDASGFLTEIEVDGQRWATYEIDQNQSKATVRYHGYTEKINYDGAGNVTEYERIPESGSTTAAQETEKIILEYDKRGNLIKIRGTGVPAVSVSYENDGVRPAMMTTPQAEARFSYEADGRVKEITHSSGISTVYKYDGDRLKQLQIANQDKQAEYWFSENGMVKSKDFLGGVSEYAYTNGRLTLVTQAQDTAKYVYDDQHRLREMHFPDGGWIEYIYEGGEKQGEATTDTQGQVVTIITHPAIAKEP